jgi:hypothetical protein
MPDKARKALVLRLQRFSVPVSRRNFAGAVIAFRRRGDLAQQPLEQTEASSSAARKNGRPHYSGETCDKTTKIRELRQAMLDWYDSESCWFVRSH